VGAAAELARVTVDLDDPHLFAVLLPEQHHRAEVASFLDRRHECPNRAVLEDDLVDDMLDPLPFLGRERLGMGEIEAQLVGPHRGPGLLDVLAKEVAERLVQHVRRRVVRHRRETD
jgi:hypothetical protein